MFYLKGKYETVLGFNLNTIIVNVLHEQEHSLDYAAPFKYYNS